MKHCLKFITLFILLTAVTSCEKEQVIFNEQNEKNFKVFAFDNEVI